MSRILAKKMYRKIGHTEEDIAVLRDTEPQILDARDKNGINAAELAGNSEVAKDHAAVAEVSATATLLGATGAGSHRAADTADSKNANFKSKGLLGCLHFTSKHGEGHGGLPTAFNDRQSILRRLAKSAKKVTPPPAHVAKPPKVRNDQAAFV